MLYALAIELVQWWPRRVVSTFPKSESPKEAEADVPSGYLL